MNLRLGTAMSPRTQQSGIDPCQPRRVRASIDHLFGCFCRSAVRLRAWATSLRDQLAQLPLTQGDASVSSAIRQRGILLKLGDSGSLWSAGWDPAERYKGADTLISTLHAFCKPFQTPP